MAANQSLSLYQIRPVRKSDAKFVWQIRNQPVVRKSSFNANKISLAKHRKWFKDLIVSNKKNFFVLESLERHPIIIGYCRYKITPGGHEVSIALDPKYHSRGLGTKLLKATIARLDNRRIVAKVKVNNVASLKFFRKNGFRITYRLINYYELEYCA